LSLVHLWQTSKDSLEGKHINQVIAFAGNGQLSDDQETSAEFRQFLSLIPVSWIERFSIECLTSKFDQGGFALQDLINEIGRRLSFLVQDGLYRGKKGSIGFDGIWTSKSGHRIVIEVKTTDAYRIDLDKTAAYRQNLIRSNNLSEDRSSILIVVGRQDTGDLEAQIRGSRHAWDVRLISVQALINLMNLKQSVDDPTIITKIAEILVPKEFTRLDHIIDLVFSAAEDAAIPEVKHLEEDDEVAEGKPDMDPSVIRQQSIDVISHALETQLVKTTRSIFASPDGQIAVTCAVSNEYSGKNRQHFWFAFHTYQKEHLSGLKQAYVSFGCGSPPQVFMIPFDEFENMLSAFNRTERSGREYWHIKIRKTSSGWIFLTKAGCPQISIDKFLLPSSVNIDV
jgi:hypothetical protein